MIGRIRGWGAQDSGVASVVACLAVSGLLATTILATQVGGVVTARHRAQAAADLAVLAGAGALDRGTQAGCQAAAVIAQRMRTRLSECRAAGWNMQIVVTAQPLSMPLPIDEVRAKARAGPV